MLASPSMGILLFKTSPNSIKLEIIGTASAGVADSKIPFLYKVRTLFPNVNA